MVACVGVGSIKGERIAIAEEMFQVGNGNREAQSFPKAQLHIDHPHHLTLVVEQRATAVAGIDLGCRLNVDDASHVAIPSTHNPLGDRPFQTQWAADGEKDRKSVV